MKMMNNFKGTKMIGKEAALRTNGVYMAGRIKNRRELGLAEEPKHEEIQYIELPAGYNGVVKEQQTEVEIPKFLLDYQDETRQYKVDYYREMNRKAINKAKVEVAKLKIRRLIENLL